MASKKTQTLFANETFMEQARKEGRVRNETLSMKVLKPDLTLQARVNHIDKDHVRALHDLLKTARADGKDGHLAPIIVFEVAPGKFKIADGFHRHEVYKREGLPGIPCCVIKGTLQEAIEYAASANQALSLPRTREDAKKAVFMLLGNGWINKSYRDIGRQSGVSASAVVKYIALYCSEKGVDEPEIKTTASGRVRAKSNRPSTGLNFQQRGRGGFLAKIDGQSVYLGKTLDIAKERFADIRSRVDVCKNILDSNTKTSGWLARRGIPFLATPLMVKRSGKCGRIAVAFMGDGVSPTRAQAANICDAIGRVMVSAEYFGATQKVVLVPELLNGHEDLIAIARRIGIEFMTLEQFVEAVKADEGEAPAPLPDDFEPNEETLRAIRDVDAGVGVSRHASVDDLFAANGI